MISDPGEPSLRPDYIGVLVVTARAECDAKTDHGAAETDVEGRSSGTCEKL